MNKTHLNIHIIGGTGQMGGWLKHFLETNGYAPTVSGSKDSSPNANIPTADVIFFAVPISHAPEVIQQTAQLAKQDAVLIDLSSIISPAAEVLRQTNHPALSLHFLFGPTITDLQSQKIVFVRIEDHPFFDELKQLFADKHAEIMEMTPEKHDTDMAHIQALTHFINLMLAETLAENNIKFPPDTTTPVFLSQYAIIMRILSTNSPKLLAEIQTLNPRFAPVLEAFIERQSHILSLLKQNSSKQIETEYDGLIKRVLPISERLDTKRKEKLPLPQSLTHTGQKIGYLGPEGTYTHQALLSFLQDIHPNPIPYNAIYDVFEAVATGEVEAGVVGAENSTEGAVRETLDYLMDFDLRAIAVIDLPIHHSLLSKELTLEDVTKVIAHPQALAQTRYWLKKHIPQAKLESAASNLAGIKRMEQEEGIAVVASAASAEKYKLNTLAENIEDNPNNVTKFYVISKQEDFSSASKTLLFVTVFNRVGVLRDMLNVFADFNISLDKIESRPSKEKNWDYYFFIQLDAAPDDPMLTQAMNMLRQYCQKIKVIGAF